MPAWSWLLVGLAALFVVSAFYGGFAELFRRWNVQEEYSHGYLIPVVALFFLWQRQSKLRHEPSIPNWGGVALLAAGCVMLLLGEITALFLLVHYAFLVVILGLVLACLGWRATRLILVPVLVLAFAIPLPYFIEADLSAGMQRISSRLGVEFIRAFGIPVHLEGNVIDLGIYRLQVAEACNGLRYLFPLMSFGFICTYVWHARFWKKALVFLSTIPITILMNSFRIGVIGLLVNQTGISAAEGFLHFFEGWVIFLACVAILLVEMLLLERLTNGGASLRDMFDLSPPASLAKGVRLERRSVPPQLVTGIGVLALTAAAVTFLGNRAEAVPPRAALATFPDQLAGIPGRHASLPRWALETLKPTDYLLVNFTPPEQRGVNLYVAYYENQRKGRSPHSPRVCIPGGGWQLAQLTREQISLDEAGSRVLRYNRVIIRRGEERALVYYWFQQRGRLLANEYLVKWYLFWDALWSNRTDGALVRLTAAVPMDESLQAADRRLREMARVAVPALDSYIPR